MMIIGSDMEYILGSKAKGILRLKNKIIIMLCHERPLYSEGVFRLVFAPVMGVQQKRQRLESSFL